MIIGFAGKAAAGKTTAARHLADLLDGNAQIIPMAQVLREEVEDFLEKSGAGQFVPLLYGNQDDKVRVFPVETARAVSACPQWNHFIDENTDIQGPAGNLTAVTVRRLLQWWGTEYRRNQDPEYWTRAWAARVEQYDLERTHILVDDVRFTNELQTLKAKGGLIVKIERPGFNGAGNHSSETSLDHYNGWDHVIVNDGTLSGFLRKIEQLNNELTD